MNTPDRKAIAAARKRLRELGVKGKLLTPPESNPKVAKNGKLGVLSAPLHLAPYNLSGFQVCPKASEGCAAACLHTAGNQLYMKAKEKSRISKTRAYFADRNAFLVVLYAEIEALVKKAAKANMKPAVRLNATSDLQWERGHGNHSNGWNIIEAFPSVQFYDYTKISKRMLRGDLPANYHLTFSLSEGNTEEAVEVLKTGRHNVAVVFDTTYNTAGKGKMFEAAQMAHGQIGGVPYAGSLQCWLAGRGGGLRCWRVIDGDEHDYRPEDPRGVIVGLKAKGDAKGDTSGFVRPRLDHITP